MRKPVVSYLICVCAAVLFTTLPPCSYARQIGMTAGVVTGINGKDGILSVDLGADDGVLSGMTFAVVDRAGRQAAAVVAGEIYPKLFWSGKIDPDELDGVSVGWRRAGRSPRSRRRRLRPRGSALRSESGR